MFKWWWWYFLRKGCQVFQFCAICSAIDKIFVSDVFVFVSSVNAWFAASIAHIVEHIAQFAQLHFGSSCGYLTVTVFFVCVCMWQKTKKGHFFEGAVTRCWLFHFHNELGAHLRRERIFQLQAIINAALLLPVWLLLGSLTVFDTVRKLRKDDVLLGSGNRWTFCWHLCQEGCWWKRRTPGI